MSHPGHESPEAGRARRLRNWMLGGVLFAVVILLFLITIVRLGGHAFQ